MCHFCNMPQKQNFNCYIEVHLPGSGDDRLAYRQWNQSSQQIQIWRNSQEQKYPKGLTSKIRFGIGIDCYGDTRNRHTQKIEKNHSSHHNVVNTSNIIIYEVTRQASDRQIPHLYRHKKRKEQSTLSLTEQWSFKHIP